MNAKIALFLILLAGAIVLLLIYGPKQNFDMSWMGGGTKAGKNDFMKPDTDIHDAVNFVK